MEPAPIKIRILIVDDQLVVREGLRMLIENHPGTKVVAMASTRSEALDFLTREACDLIILDLELGGYSATSFIPQLRDAARSARVLVLTGSRDSAIHQKAAQLGAMGVVLKEDAAGQQLKEIMDDFTWRYPKYTERQKQGQVLFMRECNGCHPGGAGGLGPGIANKPLPGFLIQWYARNLAERAGKGECTR